MGNESTHGLGSAILALKVFIVQLQAGLLHQI